MQLNVKISGCNLNKRLFLECACACHSCENYQSTKFHSARCKFLSCCPKMYCLYFVLRRYKRGDSCTEIKKSERGWEALPSCRRKLSLKLIYFKYTKNTGNIKTPALNHHIICLKHTIMTLKINNTRLEQTFMLFFSSYCTRVEFIVLRPSVLY